jgi:TetR/AcrR family transcriptional regulator, cholesterol catabolism regulator
MPEGVPRGSEQYERILSAAVELFQDKGYHATSVREIGERAGVSQSSLYYHNRSKPQILVDLNQRFMDRLIPAIAEVADRDEPADLKITAIVDALMTILTQHQGEVTLVLHERRALPAGAAEHIQQQRDEVDALIDKVIRDGIREGVLRDINVTLGRLALTGMTNWAYEWYRASGPLRPDQISSVFSDVVLNGLGVDTGRARKARPAAAKPARSRR